MNMCCFFFVFFCRQAERGGNPVTDPERQTDESHQRGEETVSQLQPLQLLHASLWRQHRPGGRARQGLVVCLSFLPRKQNGLERKKKQKNQTSLI